MLSHQYTPASLSQLGCAALKGRDRAIADALLTAGELLRNSSPGDELDLRIARAERLESDRDAGRRRLGLNGGMFCVEGSLLRSQPTESDIVCEGALRGMRFYDDVINQVDESQDDDEDPDGLLAGQEGWERRLAHPDRFWRDALGSRVQYFDDEEGTLYSCYVLTLVRRSRALPLCVAADPAAVVRAARQGLRLSQPRPGGVASPVLDQALAAARGAAATGPDALLLAADLGDLDLLATVADKLGLSAVRAARAAFVGVVETPRRRPGATDSDLGARAAAAAAFGAAAARLGWAAVGRLRARESLPDGTEDGVFVLAPPPEPAGQARQGEAGVGDRVLLFAGDAPGDFVRTALGQGAAAGGEQGPAEQCAALAPLLLAGPGGGPWEAGLTCALRWTRERNRPALARALLDLLAAPSGCGAASSDEAQLAPQAGLPTTAAAASEVAEAARAFGWEAVAEPVARLLAAPPRSAGEVAGRLWLLCRLPPGTAVHAAAALRPTLEAFLQELGRGGGCWPPRSESGGAVHDKAGAAAARNGLALLAECGGADLQAQAIGEARGWSQWSEAMRLLELAGPDDCGRADGGPRAAAASQRAAEGAGPAWPPVAAAARRFACRAAGAVLRSAMEQRLAQFSGWGWPLTPEPGTVAGYPELDGLLRGEVDTAEAGEWKDRSLALPPNPYQSVLLCSP